ncbi:translocation protein SEC62-like [Oppia nitens]|uniref:translocation protein SEC62-like n=1 Tax=Oppia nitens TaxID=1686743 RepID=UPI0023DCEB08|nr:translocation protein SEC62-like [Oppia nitens]
MADRRKTKRKAKDADVDVDSEKPSKVEYEIAKYMRSKLPPKKTTLLSHKVDYFIASKSVDLLMDSKWAKDDKRQKEALFTSRDSVVTFMDLMLRHKFFHRAKTVVVKKEKKKKLDNEESSCNEEQMKSEKKKFKKDSKETKEEIKDKEDKEGDKEVKKKEKKKIKLDMHFEQLFVDENEPYVWIYDPIPLRTWLFGAGLVFAAIAICLFPLWPRTVRNYVYYLSIAAAALLFFIIGLAVLRLIIFTIVWTVTFGKHHFWLLPNLTEDVGFWESFWPLYTHEDKSGDNNDDNKDKNNGNNDTNDGSDVPLIANEDKTDDKESGSESASTVDSITKSNSSNELNATNGVNGFEILDTNELDDK